MRVPAIVRWPGRVPAGTVCEELTTLMDFLPTFAALAGGSLPQRTIDGKNIWPLLSGEANARTPHDAFFYYQGDQLQAVRSGPWKLYLTLSRRRQGAGAANAVTEPARLYDVAHDIGEARNVLPDHPEVVEKLTKLADVARADIGDLERAGTGQRPAGWVSDPQPVLLSR